jgi:hypothetical protein
VNYTQVVSEWEESRKSLGEVQPYTAKKSAEKARYFFPFIGNEEVDEVSPCDIEQAIVTLKRDRGLSTTTLRAIHLAGTQACDWAIAHGHATMNPFKLVPRPKAANTRARSLDGAQANQLALFAKQRRDEYMAREKVQLAREGIETGVQASYTNLLTSSVEVGTQEKQVELADQNYTVVKNRYDNDLALLTDMLDASNMKLSADMALVNARINMLYNYFKLKYITNTL